MVLKPIVDLGTASDQAPAELNRQHLVEDASFSAKTLRSFLRGVEAAGRATLVSVRGVGRQHKKPGHETISEKKGRVWARLACAVEHPTYFFFEHQHEQQSEPPKQHFPVTTLDVTCKPRPPSTRRIRKPAQIREKSKFWSSRGGSSPESALWVATSQIYRMRRLCY